MDKGAWQATVDGIAKSWTQLSDYLSSQPRVVSKAPGSFLSEM